ncbi:MAG TPA: IS200/IS605 family transposase [Ktedonobacterales bacterium]|jgi:putative transposase
MDIQNYQSWRITYHFVWEPMRSKPCLVGMIAERLQTLIREKASGVSFEPLAVIILPDRVYLAAAAPPTLSPHHIVCQVKAYTSRVLRDEFPELTRIPTLWTRAYLVMTGEAIPIEEVFQRYEAMQQPRRPRGRPRKVGPPSDEEDDSPPV